jgi:predicted GIY-YIG superfamily endonuclease
MVRQYKIVNHELVTESGNNKTSRQSIYNRRTNQLNKRYLTTLTNIIKQYRNKPAGRLKDKDGLISELKQMGVLNNDLVGREGIQNIINANLTQKNNLRVKTGRGKDLFVYNSKTNNNLDNKYKKHLTTQINRFLKTKKGFGATRSQMITRLKQRGLLPENLSENTEFQQLLNSIVPESNPGTQKQSEIEKKVSKFVNELKLKRHKNWVYEDIVQLLIRNKIITNEKQITRRVRTVIQALIQRHSAKEVANQTGRYKYHISTVANVVFNVEENDIRLDRRDFEFRSDLTRDQLKEEDIVEITQNYYNSLDYPDFIELVDHKITELTPSSSSSINAMPLRDITNNKRFVNKYIKNIEDRIINFDTTVNANKCAEVLLRIELQPLIQKYPSYRYYLSEGYMNHFFGNVYTIEKMIEFLKLFKHVSVYFYDPPGTTRINYYRSDSTSSSYSILALITENHITAISEPNVKRSISAGCNLDIFNTTMAFNSGDFEFVEDALELALNPGVSDKKVITYEPTDIPETEDVYEDNFDTCISTVRSNNTRRLIHQVQKERNIVIPKIIPDQKGNIIGFVHPETDQIFMESKDYYERKELCDHFYDLTKNEAFRFKNQSYTDIAKSYAECMDLCDIRQCMSNLSVIDREMYLENSIAQPIGRSDDDNDLELHIKPAGYQNTYTFDINKQFSSILLDKQDPWVVSDMFDTWEDFDFNKHSSIPYGEYLLKTGCYGTTELRYNHCLYSYHMIKYLLEKRYITFDDILKVKVIKKILVADYFKPFVQKLYEILPAKTAKQLVVCFIGSLNMIRSKKSSYIFTDNQEYAQCMYNLYEEKGFQTQLLTEVDSNKCVVVKHEETPRYNAGTCVWRQIIECGIIYEEKLILYCSTIGSRVIAYNTDAVTVVNPPQEVINRAHRITKRKDDFDVIGEVKVEKYIKVKGRTFSEVNCANKPFYYEPVKRNILKREPHEVNTFKNKIDLSKSCLIQANLGGSGKSWLLVDVFDPNNEEHLFLLAKHEAVSNIKRTARAQGKDISNCLNRIRVIADFLNEVISEPGQLSRFKKYKTIFLDEIFQFNIHDLRMLYYATIEYGIVLIGAGAFDQADPPNAQYDLKDNSFFYDYLFGGNLIQLDYIPDSGRFKDDVMPSILNEVIQTGRIPSIISNQKANVNHWFHLTVTREMCNNLAKQCSIRFCEELPEGQQIYHEDTAYGIGLELRCNTNFDMVIYQGLSTVKVKNKRIYRVVSVSKDYLDLLYIDEGVVYKQIPLYIIYMHFTANFASTIDSFQGGKIDQSFSIWQMNSPYFSRGKLNSAIGRSTKACYVHFSNTDTDKVYEWTKYDDNIELKNELNNTDERYKNTYIYAVKEKGRVIYIGHTLDTNTRLKQHLKESITHPTTKFHKYLANVDHKTITLQVLEEKSFINRSQAETYELQVIQKYMEDHDLLNTIKKKQVKEDIKVSDDLKQITVEEYNKIKDYQIIDPSIQTKIDKKITKVKFILKGKVYEKLIRWGKIRSEDEAKRIAYEWRDEMREKFYRGELD